jgi:hypothetical protein
MSQRKETQGKICCTFLRGTDLGNGGDTMSDGCNYRRVYVHSENGIPMSGSRNELEQAIRDGADVRIRYQFSGPVLSGAWTRTCSSVTIAEPSDAGAAGGTIISCIVTDIPDTETDLTTGRTFAKPFAFEVQSYNTSGHRHLVKFDRQTGAVLSESTDRLLISWLVRGDES